MSGSTRRSVERALDVAARSGRTQWLALRTEEPLRDPLADFAAAARADDRFYWERPADGRALFATGAAWRFEAEGPERFDVVAERVRALFADLHTIGADAPAELGPRVCGGFAFADEPPDPRLWNGFPSARLVLPQRLVAVGGGRCVVTTVARAEPGASADAVLASLRARPELVATLDTPAPGAPAYRIAADRPRAAYCDLVARALYALADGDLEKVVVARSVTVARGEPFEPAPLLDTLRRAHPTAATFAVGRGDATFLGATPEQLVRVRGRHVETAALAGSAPRGRSPEEDARLSLELLESKKEQAEHAIVVRALREALAPHCTALTGPEAPVVRRLDGIQHLETPLAGELADDASALSLLGSLHPTPAVGGAPRDGAVAWIAAHESLERGWYAGPVGWADASGDAEFAVALRCALLRGGEARLFAGAGIVPGSRPDAELRETQLKLRTLLAPLLEI